MPANGSDTKPTASQTEPTGATQSEPEATETQGQATQEPKGPEGKAEDANLTDRHGQLAISAGKYEREMAAKDARIRELESQAHEAAKSEERYQALKKELDEERASWQADKVRYKLEAAGCVNAKAAMAVLEDYDGDVDKLKAECPYLFAQDKPRAGSTGLPTGGAPDAAEARRAKARAAAGLTRKG